MFFNCHFSDKGPKDVNVKLVEDLAVPFLEEVNAKPVQEPSFTLVQFHRYLLRHFLLNPGPHEQK
jgi:hypothetical protein